MGHFELSPDDVAYFVLRLLLSGLSVIAAASCLHFAWQARGDGRPWRLAGAGGVLLVMSAILSADDAIDNTLLRPEDPITLTSWLWLFLFDLMMPIWTLLLIAAWRARDEALAELSRLSITDQLTGTLNRRGFFERAATSIAQEHRAGLPATVIMLDIDYFKVVNDSYGHAAGDDVLRDVVAVLSATMRPGDLLGRVGGEEFAVFLHDTTTAAAVQIADRLRSQVGVDVTHPAGPDAAVTVSGGVAPVPDSFEPETALTMALTRADGALYQAKREGRNRIVAAVADRAALIGADNGPGVG